MKINVVDYEMTHEEIISELVQLKIEKTLDGIKIKSLVQLLIEKEIIADEEVKLSLENILSFGETIAEENGIDSKMFLEIASKYL
ncbi:hypothetical protein [Paenisporosarcina sp. NPDC076898]|uniref:hypothetical protein n=1 Tax=unclassified Paenisporosarcina TaxID=2642018 RepID=UPI003CFCD503